MKDTLNEAYINAFNNGFNTALDLIIHYAEDIKK